MKTYLKLAWHSLLKNPFFSFIILFGISITIMVVLFVGSLLDTGYGSHGVYKNIDRILIAPQLTVKRTGKKGISNSGFSYKAYKDHISKMTTPIVMGVTKNQWRNNLYYKDLSLSKISCKSIDENFTKIFPLEFIIGRPFTKEDLDERRKVVIITEGIAESLFNKEEDALGKKIKTSSEVYEIVGVVKNVNEMRRQAGADIYIPLNIYLKENEDWHVFLGSSTIFMKFDDKEDMIAGQEEFQQIMNSMPIDSQKNEEKLSAKILTEKGWLIDNMLDIEEEKLFYVYLSLIAFFVMFIPALSLINLNITRTSERTAEMGIRKAFGASSTDLFKQLIIENVFTTFIGGVIGTILTFFVIYLFNTYNLIGFGNNYDLEINFTLLIYGVFCTLFFSILSGFYPALKIANFGIIHSLKNDKQ
ncbi:ABC transporter permease [Flammeovirga kamogawensis]|uniref:ABC transporter permease n=1 Tax=Flammeovirga kamogawensis TaxID=373891 RepID=A0ABX8H2Z9_9BACT|nr:ABC transporter permease [Flammeovirga kamogawensis]MBB6460485.1 putative ABC transport system permease protein [Flammeovirga kamogawensis]QWG10291.1 ABC transporter permease [Flammeovirga kamogawensis]TRX64739.1 FtsX-like permease family protein [Flammeovirga kamogawensis]